MAAAEVTQTPTAKLCGICCEPFTRILRSQITCSYCHEGSCRSCCQRYLLGLEDAVPACLFCRKPWNRDFVHANFPKAFVRGALKIKRQDTLVKVEEALLPATQEMAQAEAERLRLATVKAGLEVTLASVHAAMINDDVFEGMRGRDLRPRLRDLWIEHHDIRHRMMHLARVASGQTLTVGNATDAAAAASADARRFLKRCPAEGCNGYLSARYTCGMCSLQVCPQCLCVMDPEKHECNPDDVATAKLIMRDTRPCPSCATPIHKIDGCDQMWCVQCHTAFSWRTLRVETGRVHNPHWYEWQRKNSRDGNIPREPGDGPRPGGCDGDGGHHHVRLPSYNRLLRSGKMTLRLEMIHQLLSHIELIELNNFRRTEVNPNDNRDLRIKFLLNRISKTQWKKLLQEREKRRDKEQAMRHALEVLVYGAADIFRCLISTRAHADGVAITSEDAGQQLDNLRVYANECIADVIHRFDCTFRFHVDEDWTICRRKHVPTPRAAAAAAAAGRLGTGLQAEGQAVVQSQDVAIQT